MCTSGNTRLLFLDVVSILGLKLPEDDDLYSTDIIVEDAYPECECEEICEECDA